MYSHTHFKAHSYRSPVATCIKEFTRSNIVKIHCTHIIIGVIDYAINRVSIPMMFGILSLRNTLYRYSQK